MWKMTGVRGVVPERKQMGCVCVCEIHGRWVVWCARGVIVR